jgi:hypothetical protein
MFSTLNTPEILKIIVISLFSLGTISLASGIFILFKKVMGEELKIIKSQDHNRGGRIHDAGWFYFDGCRLFPGSPNLIRSLKTGKNKWFSPQSFSRKGSRNVIF